MTLSPQEQKLFDENWHAIIGANGMCECGTENGTCGERLKSFIATHYLSKERVRELKEEVSKMEWEQLSDDGHTVLISKADVLDLIKHRLRSRQPSAHQVQKDIR